MVDFRITWTLQIPIYRVPFRASSSFLSRFIKMKRRDLVGTVSNPDRSGSRESGQAYAVRLETAPTGGESVYLFLEFTII